MSIATKLRRGPLLLGTAAAATISLTACGASGAASSSSSDPTPSVSVDKTLSAKVPAALKSKTLNVATAATYPPMEYMASDGQTIQGMEPDLITAVSQVLGLKIKIVNATFDTIIPGLSSGKYDVAISSMNATPEREKVVTMVSVRTGGSSFVAKAQGGPKVETLADLCGLKVAAMSGSTQQGDVAEQAKKCAAAGKPKLQAMVFADQNQEFLALSSGRAQILVAGAPGNAWKVKESNGQLALTGQAYDVETTAMALPKDSPLAKPMSDAINALIQDGTYKKILTKWGVYVDGIALSKSEANPGAPAQP